MSDISKALAEAKALVAALESHDGTPNSHRQLLKRTDSIRRTLEDPYDKATRWFESSAISASVYILLRINALQKLPPPNSPQGISAESLAVQCRVDASVVTRAMRVLLVDGLTIETAPDEYAHNEKSASFAMGMVGNFVCICDEFMKTWLQVPEYVRSHEPQDLYDLRKTPYVYSAGHEGKTYYEALDVDPEERDLWNKTLQMMERNFPILGMFDFGTAAEQARKQPERPFLVDIGGGRGQALHAIRQDCEGLSGLQLILQDLPIVIDSLNQGDLPGVELMKHDIFTPQPVKSKSSSHLLFSLSLSLSLFLPRCRFAFSPLHVPTQPVTQPLRCSTTPADTNTTDAHIYFLRRLLHDFYNPVCIDILRHIVPAMGPDSRLLICDMLVPSLVEPGDDAVTYWLDLALLAIGGKEKTLSEFHDIFDEVGLELVAVHKASFGHTATLEVVLKRQA